MRYIPYGCDVCQVQKVLVRTAWRTSQMLQERDRKALATRGRSVRNERFKGVALASLGSELFLALNRNRYSCATSKKLEELTAVMARDQRARKCFEFSH